MLLLCQTGVLRQQFPTEDLGTVTAAVGAAAAVAAVADSYGPRGSGTAVVVVVVVLGYRSPCCQG